MKPNMLHLYLLAKRSSCRRRFDKVARPWPFRSLLSSTVGRPLSCCGLLRCRLILSLTGMMELIFSTEFAMVVRNETGEQQFSYSTAVRIPGLEQKRENWHWSKCYSSREAVQSYGIQSGKSQIPTNSTRRKKSILVFSRHARCGTS